MSGALGGRSNPGAGAVVAPDGRIQSIQILRAIAALVVVAYHATVLWHDKGGAPSNLIWENGQSGVDLFFAISGFIILVTGAKMAQKPGAAGKFLELRLIRLIPLYWLATTAKLVLVMLAPDGTAVNGKPSFWHTVASYLFIPSNNAIGRPLPVLAVGWTLSYEMLFYLLFALTMIFALDPLLVIVPLLAGLSLLSLFRTDSWPTFMTLANPLLLEFCFGMLVARAFATGKLQRLPTWANVALVAAGLAYLFVVPEMGPWTRALGWGVAAAAALTGALSLERYVKGRLMAGLVLLGEASYALYLTHGFVLPAVGIVAAKLHITGYALGATLVVVSVIASTAVAIATYILLERPMTNVLRRYVQGMRKTPVPA